MARDWKRLGDAVKRARAERGLRQAQLAEAIDADLSTVQNLESARYGKGFTRVPPTAHAAAAYFRWPEGAIADILNGGDPDLGEAPALPDAEGTLEEEAADRPRNVLPLRVASELDDDGELIDATVMDLSSAGSDARMIVVVKGTPDMSPDELRQAVDAWKETRRRMTGDGEPEGPDSPSVANGA